MDQWGERRRPAGDQERHGGGAMIRWGETWWWRSEGRRPAGDQEGHGGGAMG